MNKKFKRIFLIVVLALVGIVLFVYIYSVIAISNSEAYIYAKNHIEKNKIIENKIGKVIDFGDFPYGGIGYENNIKKAQINLKIIAEKKEVDAQINMQKSNSDEEWTVISLILKKE